MVLSTFPVVGRFGTWNQTLPLTPLLTLTLSILSREQLGRLDTHVTDTAPSPSTPPPHPRGPTDVGAAAAAVVGAVWYEHQHCLPVTYGHSALNLSSAPIFFLPLRVRCCTSFCYGSGRIFHAASPYDGRAAGDVFSFLLCNVCVEVICVRSVQKAGECDTLAFTRLCPATAPRRPRPRAAPAVRAVRKLLFPWQLPSRSGGMGMIE